MGKIRQALTFLAVISLICFSIQTVANQLYTARVSLVTHDLDQALSQALEKVLIKVSGNPEVTTVPMVRPAISSPKMYVNEYHTGVYTNKETPYVEASFAPRKINQLLSQGGQTLWLDKRPPVTVWAVVLKNHTIEPLTEDHALGKQFQQTAAGRGFGIEFPMWDIVDYNHLNPSDISALDLDAVIKANQRYKRSEQGSPLLIGVIMSKKQAWQTEWVLYDGDKTYTWQTMLKTAVSALRSDVDHAFRQMAEERATLNSARLKHWLQVRVIGVQSMYDLNAVQNELRSLSLVDNVSLNGVNKHSALLNIKIFGNINTLKSYLKSNRHVKFKTNAANEPYYVLKWRG